jgi:phage-related protein
VAEARGKLRPLVWVGTSLRDLKGFPDEVQDEIGYGLFLAQSDDKHRKAKPLRGFGGAGVLEMISDHRGNTYRAVYTVRLAHAVYVLHAFQKKSKHRIETSERDLELIRQRLKEAGQMEAQTISAGKV